jgi:magnesium transporter
MVTVYYTNEKQELEITNSDHVEDIYSKINSKSWIYLTSSTSEEINKISELTKIPATVIISTLDEEESAHIDIDEDVTLVVVDTPVMEVEDLYPDIHKFYATPFEIMFNNEYFVTTSLKAASIEKDLTSRWMKNFATNKHIKLTI